MLKAPFTGEPTEVFKTEWRYAGMSFTEKGVAITDENDRADADAPHVDVREGFAAAPRKVWELRIRRSPTRIPARRCHARAPARSCRSATPST